MCDLLSLTPTCRFSLCDFTWPFVLKVLLHRLQAKGLAPVCTRWCVSSWERSPKDLVQVSQGNRRTSMCSWLCCLMAEGSLKVFPHVSHVYSFMSLDSKWAVRMWRFRLLGCERTLSQNIHLNSRDDDDADCRDNDEEALLSLSDEESLVWCTCRIWLVSAEDDLNDLRQRLQLFAFANVALVVVVVMPFSSSSSSSTTTKVVVATSPSSSILLLLLLWLTSSSSSFCCWNLLLPCWLHPDAAKWESSRLTVGNFFMQKRQATNSDDASTLSSSSTSSLSSVAVIVVAAARCPPSRNLGKDNMRESGDGDPNTLNLNPDPGLLAHLDPSQNIQKKLRMKIISF